MGIIGEVGLRLTIKQKNTHIWAPYYPKWNTSCISLLHGALSEFYILQWCAIEIEPFILYTSATLNKDITGE